MMIPPQGSKDSIPLGGINSTSSNGSSAPVDHSMRHCKAFLRRRLAYGPPIPSNSRTNNPRKRSKVVGSGESLDAQNGDNSAQAARRRWWPVGRESQCEELRAALPSFYNWRRRYNSRHLGNAGGSASASAGDAGASAATGVGSSVLRRTTVNGESQSALLLGYTGTGKSLVVDRVLRCLAEEATTLSGGGKKKRRAKEQSATVSEAQGVASDDAPMDDLAKPIVPFRAVYLNGMAQTDDNLAMRELVQQLGITGQPGTVYSSNLEMAVQWMKTGAVNGIPVVFILDEFDVFACRRPQTLLYALLDLCQDKSICAAVVGLSVNLNVLDAAEKRIKSRFSFRQIRFPTQDFDTIMTIVKDALTVPEGGVSAASDEEAIYVDGEGAGVGRGTLMQGVATPPGLSTSFAREFNAVTRQVLLGNTARRNGEGLGLAPAGDSLKAATAELRALAESGRSVGWFLRLASVAVSLLREGEDKGLTRAALKRAAEMIAPDPHAQALRALSVTQVLVLVAMSRLERRGRSKGCPSQTVFREYESYMRKFPGCPLRFSRSIIFKSFQQLAEQGLIRAAEPGSGGRREAHPMLHARFRSRYSPREVLDALVKESVRAPTNVVQWCKNWQKET